MTFVFTRSDTRITLQIVIVNKDDRSLRYGHSPPVVDEASQLLVAVDSVRDFGWIAEFGYHTFIRFVVTKRDVIGVIGTLRTIMAREIQKD